MGPEAISQTVAIRRARRGMDPAEVAFCALEMTKGTNKSASAQEAPGAAVSQHHQRRGSKESQCLPGWRPASRTEVRAGSAPPEAVGEGCSRPVAWTVFGASWPVEASPQSLPSVSQGILPVGRTVSKCPHFIKTPVPLEQGPTQMPHGTDLTGNGTHLHEGSRPQARGLGHNAWISGHNPTHYHLFL